MTTRLALIASALLFSACTQNAGPNDEGRHPLGKADASGSCTAADCGEQSANGNCFCDDECTFYGDCCSNKAAVCDGGVAQNCGGLAGLACGQGEYCQYDATAVCGAADQLGVCQPTPQACTFEFAEVCGCNDQTYSNSCFAAMAGTSVAYDGPCQTAAQNCGGFAGLQCDAGEYCKWEPSQTCGAADHLGTCEPMPEVCIQLFDPVCGCNGQTYSNACFAAAAGQSVASQGACN